MLSWCLPSVLGVLISRAGHRAQCVSGGYERQSPPTLLAGPSRSGAAPRNRSARAAARAARRPRVTTCAYRIGRVVALASAGRLAPAEASMARKYSKASGRKVERAMKERKQGKLHSGRSGKMVTSRKQAIAIGLSEARREGKKVPKKKSS